jgi:hypothetical protein
LVQFLREDGTLDFEGLLAALDEDEEKTTNSEAPEPGTK